MPTSQFKLSEQMRHGPSVLFLGQNYLSLDSGSDPFLAQILHKYAGDITPENYDQILHIQLPPPEIFLAWAKDRVDRHLSTPPWLTTVANFAWSHVYTSSIDTLWYKNFRTDWRELFPIYQEKIKPSEIRSRVNMCCTFLYGCIDQPANDPEFRPPLTNLEKNRRNQEAVALMRRLPEIVTPFGVLVIEGYNGNTDWLSWDNLLPTIDALQPGQTHIFSVSDELLQNSDIRFLIDQQKIILHTENLASYLLEEAHNIKFGLLKDDIEGKKRISIDNEVIYVPHELFNAISRTAILVDDSIFEPLPPLQVEGNYAEFRHFLCNSSKRPVWSGYSRGFNFKRDFEGKLLALVEQRINSQSLQKYPVILHGPSGTGKTVALGSLAYEIRKNKRCAVLFIERKPVRPAYADLDEFAGWAEKNGSPVTLIIWDGMVDPDEYEKLLNYLTSRGRKVVLVGSCYENGAQTKIGRRFEVSATSNFQNELERFEQHLIKIDPAMKRLRDSRQLATRSRKSLRETRDQFDRESIDPYFLVALYRRLPETHSQLQDGIIHEVNFAQEQLLNSTQVVRIPHSSLAYALYQAGLITDEDLTLTQQVIIDDENITEVEKLIGLVMVPGRFGLDVPVQLLVRAMHRSWMDMFTKILSEVTIFNVDPDGETVGPRHPLEAELIVNKRMGAAETEISYAKELLIELSPSAEIDSYEFQFAVELIKRMGPNGKMRAYFGPFFKVLSEVLEELRTKRGIANPRLMLQEAVLLREWVKEQDGAGGSLIPDVEKAEIYRKAAHILELAIRDNRSVYMKPTILAETGANLGAWNKVNIRAGKIQEAMLTYEKAKGYLLSALRMAPTDYHPLDVIAWMTEDLIESTLLPDKQKAGLAADWLHLFSIAASDEYGNEQAILYNSKLATLARILENRELLAKSFEALEKLGSKAGYYLQAFWIIRDTNKRSSGSPGRYLIPTNEPAEDKDILGYKKALQYLDDNRSEIGNDGRCLNLKFKLWWLINTKQPLFLYERQTLAFTAENWRYILNLSDDLLNTEDIFYSTPIKYTKAMALFHLGNYTGALDLFREIDRESIQNVKGPKRIFRHYLASDSNGNPLKYEGRILWVNLEQDRGEVYVPSLSKRITFIPRDFPRWNEMRKDQPLPAFHIAFNFIGPIADPVARYHKGK